MPDAEQFHDEEERAPADGNGAVAAPSSLGTREIAFASNEESAESMATSKKKGGGSGSGTNKGHGKSDDFKLKMRMRLKKLSTFWPFKVAQLLCVVYILVLTFSNYPTGLVDPATGNIVDPNSLENTANGVILINGDYRPVVAIGLWQKCCLAISRMSAFSMYPMLILIFLTKCKALHSIFSKTPLSMFLVLNEAHELHTYAGNYIALDVWIHTLFHLLRWADQGNVSLLWRHRTGLSGLIVVVATPFITLPMIFWKRKIPYEVRKGLHYLFVLFAVGMCFHAPMSAIPNGGFIAPVMGGSIFLFTLDAIWVYLFMTEKIETTTFHVLSSGVRITMPVSEKFQNRSQKGGFAYVCLPWVDRLQWHAFSLFEDPNEPRNRQVFMMKTGDWTRAVHTALQRDTVRPVWIQGPFPSPYNEAEVYDNQILVASGIGITPALSVIRAHKDSRRINLIWAVRDPAMLEFFLEHMYLDHDGWNLIFYTGKEPLVPALEELNSNVRVIKRRPDLKSVIPNIIYGIESGTGLPEVYSHTEMVRMKEMLIERMHELENMGHMSSKEKLAELTAFVNAQGFSFTELIQDIKNENKKQRSIAGKSGRAVESTRDLQGDLESDLLGSTRTELSSGTTQNLGASTMLREIQEFEDYVFSSNGNLNANIDDRRSLLAHALPVGGNSSRRRRSSGGNGMWMSIRQNFHPHMSDRNVGKALTGTFKPWEKNAQAEIFIKSLDQEQVLPTWGIMYCGGSPPVQQALKEISEEYHIGLNIDSFAW